MCFTGNNLHKTEIRELYRNMNRILLLLQN